MNCNWIENKRRQIYYSKFKPCKPLGSSAVWQKTILFHVFFFSEPFPKDKQRLYVSLDKSSHLPSPRNACNQLSCMFIFTFTFSGPIFTANDLAVGGGPELESALMVILPSCLLATQRSWKKPEHLLPGEKNTPHLVMRSALMASNLLKDS